MWYSDSRYSVLDWYSFLDFSSYSFRTEDTIQEPSGFHCFWWEVINYLTFVSFEGNLSYWLLTFFFCVRSVFQICINLVSLLIASNYLPNSQSYLLCLNILSSYFKVSAWELHYLKPCTSVTVVDCFLFTSMWFIFTLTAWSSVSWLA